LASNWAAALFPAVRLTPPKTLVSSNTPLRVSQNALDAGVVVEKDAVTSLQFSKEPAGPGWLRALRLCLTVMFVIRE